MKTSTRQVIKILLDADDTIPVEQRQNIWSEVRRRPGPDSLLPLLLTQRQAGNLLGMSRWSIRAMAQKGQLHPVKILGSTRFNREEIEKIAKDGAE